MAETNMVQQLLQLSKQLNQSLAVQGKNQSLPVDQERFSTLVAKYQQAQQDNLQSNSPSSFKQELSGTSLPVLNNGQGFKGKLLPLGNKLLAEMADQMPGLPEINLTKLKDLMASLPEGALDSPAFAQYSMLPENLINDALARTIITGAPLGMTGDFGGIPSTPKDSLESLFAQLQKLPGLSGAEVDPAKQQNLLQMINKLPGLQKAGLDMQMGMELPKLEDIQQMLIQLAEGGGKSRSIFDSGAIISPQSHSLIVPIASTANSSIVVPTPVVQAGWGNAVSDRVVWLANQGVHTASLQLDPPDLGPLEVRVNLNHETAHVVFSSNNSAVRDSLEASLDRLRDDFAENGYNLVDVDINDSSTNEREVHEQLAEYGYGADTEMGESEMITQLPKAPEGLIDYFA